MWALVGEGVTYCSYVAPSTFESHDRISVPPRTSGLDGGQRAESSTKKRRPAFVLQGERGPQSELRIPEGRRTSDPADEHRP